jgi:hypothetical protein
MLRVREMDGSSRAPAAQAVACNHKAYTNSSVGVLCRDIAAHRCYEETI